MILVDTSVWIDLFSRTPRHYLAPEAWPRLATCGPVIQEVLQGARDQAFQRLRDGMLALPRLGDPVDIDLYLEAASLYRHARQKGYTVRSSVDCLIAAVAMRCEATVWHADRDFEAIGKFAALRTLVARSLPMH